MSYVIAMFKSTFITFSSDSSFTLSTYNTAKNWEGTLYYSTTPSNEDSYWTVWNGTTALSAGLRSDGKYYLYLRGRENSKIATASAYRWVLTGSNISCSGNIENLLDYQIVKNGGHPTMSMYCYCGLFYNCTSLVSAPELSAVTATQGCYMYMFYGCTSLTTSPELPATMLDKNCYYGMFYGCTALTAAPSLSATELASGCYNHMFHGCTSLITAPELPATTLADNCYEEMFDSCTALTSAPALPATTLVKRCYFSMFYSCTSLMIVPELPATVLADNCYQNMFYNCISLTTLPELPAIVLTDSCYSQMFYSCSLIKLSTSQIGDYQTPYRIPSNGAGTNGTNSVYIMFGNTGGTFKSTPSINTTYYTSNTVIPAT